MRPSEKLAVFITIGVFLLSGFALYKTAQHNYGTEIPKKGGEVREGIIGYARFVNPLLAFSDADKTLTTLIYSGLLKTDTDGKLIGDIANSWSVSTDGLIYTVNIKPSAQFHDGQPVTTDDVEFTIQKAIDPQIKSPKTPNWLGVTINKISPYEITFTLKKPYSPFAENLTIGILPKHIWGSIAPEAFDVSSYNKEPIGSGPFKIKSTRQNKSGLYEYYELESFEKYTLGAPYIDKLILSFYRNEKELSDAFVDGKINLVGGISADLANETLKKAKLTEKTTLPRIFALFFNQNTDPVLINKEVRKALSISVDKEALIKEILKGYGTEANSPIPFNINNYINTINQPLSINELVNTSGTTTSTYTPFVSVASENRNTVRNITEARTLLESSGWKISTSSNGVYEKTTSTKEKLRLSFTITTSNSPELKHTAELLQNQWAQIGADVKIDIFESNNIAQRAIRPRKYSSLLFGQVTGRDVDLYPFWHSSQRVDPGLNIALYANIKADKALEISRSTTDPDKQLKALADFEKEISIDIPAIFLFSPEYIYGSNINIKGIHIKALTEPSERFINVHEWYTDTKFTWKKKNNEIKL